MTSEQAVGRLIDLLEQEGVGYLLVGAFSSNFYGVPRATNDANVVVQFTTFNLVEFCRRLGDDFVLDRQMLIEGFTGSVRNAITFKPTGFTIEIFRLGNDPHHQERFARRRRLDVPECGCEAWVAAPEDVVIQKLRWARRKDLDDIVNLLAVSGSRRSSRRAWTQPTSVARPGNTHFSVPRQPDLPETMDAVGIEFRVTADHRHGFGLRLRDKEPVEWVLVMDWQGLHRRGMGEADGQQFKRIGWEFTCQEDRRGFAQLERAETA